ncbi:MAG TPA: glycosyltransferase family 4 protein [Polyangiaceae bacterium]
MTERRAERVVVVTSSYPAHADDPSGHFVAAEVRLLCDAGNDVVVLTPETRASGSWFWNPKPPHGFEAGPAGERVVRLPAGDAFGWPGALERLRARPLRAFGALSFVRSARRALATKGPWDRVIAHFLVPCAWPLLDALTPPAARLEAVAHGSDARLVGRLPGPVRRRIARLLAGYDVRCTSAELRSELTSALGDGVGGRIRVETPPLELVARPSRSDARRALGIAADARLLVVAGRLVRGKRTDVALRAAQLVPNALVVAVGDGPERAALEREFPQARFVGLVARSRALDWLAAADALIVASREEGAPSVVREARALGTPVVALPSGDLRAWQARDPGLFVVPVASP